MGWPMAAQWNPGGAATVSGSSLSAVNCPPPAKSNRHTLAFGNALPEDLDGDEEGLRSVLGVGARPYTERTVILEQLAAAPARIEISLLGTFEVRVGTCRFSVTSRCSQRLLVFLALHDRILTRIAIAGTIWPEVSDQKAGVSLRSSLSRMGTPMREAIVAAPAHLHLATNVTVDYRESQALAHRLLQPKTPPRESDLNSNAVSTLSGELLPDWYDDWVVAEAEDWRQLRMSALEAQARILTACGRLPEAAGAARAAMRAEPLRESAHATLVRVHLAEGNQSEALRVFDRYRTLLLDELDLEPTPLLSDLVASIRN
jgi:DNA-binding SARP family transcriptional activator